ncbi:embigin [Mixophyes fleayi]|uniref:embigin n=1 Tax=Mixophyes fleayi TaxID=3061075 RepID=UPI003F4DA215
MQLRLTQGSCGTCLSQYFHSSQRRAQPHSAVCTVPRCPPSPARMRLSLPVLVPLFCGLLSVASPGITPNTAGPDVTAQASVKNDGGGLGNTVVIHSLSIPGVSSPEIEKTIIIDSTGHLKLECNLTSDSKGLQINNVTWRHGEEQISRDLYMYNKSDNQWHTSYEFVVKDMNETGNYTCMFISSTEVKGTFHIQVPAVHVVGKSIVSYNGDSIVMKCDTSIYKPVEWIWYKVTENEQVVLNFSLISAKYTHDNKNGNETKLHIANLSEGDSGSYVCKAVFKTGESEGQVHLNVLSYMVPARIFLAIAAEVAVLVAVILVYEMLSKKKKDKEDVKNNEQIDQMAQLKSEDSSNADASSTRQRK